MFSSIFKSKANPPNKRSRSTIFRVSPYWIACIPLVAIILITWNTAAMAQDGQPSNFRKRSRCVKLDLGISHQQF